MDELKRWLEETERMWAAQLAAFKAHLESRRRRRGVSSKVLVALRVRATPERAFAAFVERDRRSGGGPIRCSPSRRATRACWRSSRARAGG